MGAFKKIVDFFDKITNYAAFAAFAVMSLMIILQVIYRKAGASLSFSEELARFLFIWATLLGAPMCLKRRSHVGFDLIMTNMPRPIRKYGGLLTNLIGMVFYLVMIIYGFKVTAVTMGQTSPALGLKMGFVYLSVPVAGILMMINGAYNIVEDLSMFSKSNKMKGVAKT